MFGCITGCLFLLTIKKENWYVPRLSKVRTAYETLLLNLVFKFSVTSSNDVLVQHSFSMLLVKVN